MKTRNTHPPKAYENKLFLQSPNARTLRILSEFLEPMTRFRREGIKDTIVLFGSARILPRKIAYEKLKNIRATLKKTKRYSKIHKQKLYDASIDYEMSAYYEDAAK